MNAFRLPLASSTVALLAACTHPEALDAVVPEPSRPEEIPGPAYTTTTTATLTPAPGRTFGRLAAASAGDQAAIAYTESDEADGGGVVRSRVLLQRLDAMGAADGPPVELATVESNDSGPPALTLATDGDRYLACWQRESSIACAGAPVGEGPAFPALSVDGAWPSLAYGSGTLALAYGAPGYVAVVRVASDGSAAGSPASFATGEGTFPRAFLGATESGFALADADDAWNSPRRANVRVRRLASTFAPLAPPIDLGMQIWFRASLAAHGANVAIGLSRGYGGRVFTLEGAEVTHNYAFDGGGKLGLNVALLANEASIDMLATYNETQGGVDPGLGYRVLQGDEVIASELALVTEGGFQTGETALLRLHGDLFITGTDRREGEEITVARLDRP